jgi:outer membrane protein assembly factor BamB
MGSGFFIAPYTVITAAHVVKALWDELRMPWERGHYPRTAVDRAFYVILGHVPDADRPETLARWQATSATPSAYTDIAFLNVVPVNNVAERLEWPSFPELLLLSPEEGSTVASDGYPEVRQEQISEGTVRVSPTSELTTGVVLATLNQGRGSWQFPQFQTSANFKHGMSGGPVIHDGKICGVVSYATTYDSNSYAAALWPVLLDRPAMSVDPRSGIPLLGMLETGRVLSQGWRAVLQRATVIENENGRKVAILRHQSG